MAANDHNMGFEFLHQFTPPQRNESDQVLGEIDARRRQLGMSWDRAAAEFVLEHRRRIEELEDELENVRCDAAYWEARVEELRKLPKGGA